MLQNSGCCFLEKSYLSNSKRRSPLERLKGQEGQTYGRTCESVLFLKPVEGDLKEGRCVLCKYIGM